MISSLETRSAINCLELAEFHKSGATNKNEHAERSKKARARPNKDLLELISQVLKPHQAQTAGPPVLKGFQNERSLTNELKDILEGIQHYKIYVPFMAETWHDPESISISKLRSRKNKTKTFRVSENRSPTIKKVFDSTFQGMLLKLASSAQLCVRIRSSSKSVIWLFIAKIMLIHCFTKFEEILNILAI